MSAQIITANESAGQQVAAAQGDSAFNLMYRRAKAMSSASLVPKDYRDNIPNTMIALELADRIGASPMQVMQNLHIIQGKPSWSASFLIATVNACGRFKPMRFEVVGDDPHDKTYKVRAYAEDKESGERCDGPWVTWKMVEAEGWHSKTGSKWKTMPGPMFMYRAASFWSRIFAPEVSMGIHTADEVEDVWGGVTQVAPASIQRADLKSLESRLLGQEAQAEEAPPADSDGVLLTVEEMKSRFAAASNQDELDDAYNDVSMFPDAERKALHEAYEFRRDELELQ